MAVSNQLHKALASDDPAERRDGLLQLALLLGDRIELLDGLRRQAELAVQQIDRNEGHKPADGRKVLKSRHLKSTQSTVESIEALIAST
ncbi:hypothetical protein [Sphingomonas sp. Leaf21]|uniref:hypothetical protein n=1 Tax=Sphingomonas sp. Leaf21 TaxID=2876550 RepID=UPI001E3D9995|nr:hypothetical protein [Sphingomonas sp. Leaf21]